MAGVFISPVSGAVDPSNYSTIDVDGYIDPAEWTGNVSVFDDPDNVWGGAGVNKLYAAINETGLFLGLESTQYGGGNPRMIWIDADENRGITDHDATMDDGDALPYDRVINFTGMMPDFFVYGGGNGTIQVFNYTGSGVDDITGLVLAEARNQTIMTGLFDVHYEVFIPFDVLYGSTIPADSIIKLAAAHFGSNNPDTWADILPNDRDGVSQSSVEYSGFVNLQITNGLAEPEITIPKATGIAIPTVLMVAELVEDKLIPGFDFEFEAAFMYDYHDPMNTADYPTLHMRLYNISGDESVGDWMNYTMGHYAGEYAVTDMYDLFHLELPNTIYNEDDVLEWFVSAEEFSSEFQNVTIGAMPPVRAEWFGAPDPSGGLQEPNSPLTISFNFKQVFVLSTGETSVVQSDVGTQVILNYTVNETETWLTRDFTYKEASGDEQVTYTVDTDAYGEETDFYFNIIINTTDGKNVTGTTHLIFVTPPPEEIIFTQLDSAHDEYGIYGSEGAFGPAAGVGDGGIWDLLNYTVTANQYQTTYWFQMREVYDPEWGKGYASHPLYQVYVETGEAVVETTESASNAFVNIDPDHPWDYAFHIAGWDLNYYTPSTIEDPQTSGHGITALTYEEVNGENWFYFSVPFDLAGEVAQANWNYTVLVGSNDGGLFRNHVESTSDGWRIWGGDDGTIDPNFMDILVPLGGDENATQEFIVEGYNKATSTFTTVYAVGNDIVFVNDTTDPLVSITTPADSYELDAAMATSGTVELTWTSSDPAVGTFYGLQSIQVFVDSDLVSNVNDGSETLTFTANGTYTVTINVFDKSGNYGTDEISITVVGIAPESTDDEPTDDEPTDDDGGFNIPGYSFAFMVVGIAAISFYLIRKKK